VLAAMAPTLLPGWRSWRASPETRSAARRAG
jgi:hypothetical protein